MEKPDPQNTSSERRLAAILFADIVGYTAMMQSDEALARQSLEKFRNTLNEIVPQHKGNIIQYYGDGCLCTFDSAVDSMHCAQEIQTIYNEEPKVPVRVGLHSGDVFFEADNVYGDSVNIASRIESLGDPGSILFSKRIKRHIANQSEFKVQSIGEFEFKNVEKTMEVFALANEGFVVPINTKVKEKGKQIQPKASSKKYLLIPVLLGALLIIGVGFWLSNSDDNNDIMVSSLNLPPNTPLPMEFRDKRVAVMVFDNKTGNKDLDDFGTMISDWLTRGLMETGEAKVISAANIQPLLVKVGLKSKVSPELSKTTGAGIVLQGRYFVLDDKLIIHANIVDAKQGQVLHALEPIEGKQTEMRQLLEDLTAEVLGFWAVKNRLRFLQNPPKYEAYQKLLKGDEFFASDFEKAETFFKEAYQQDTTFYAPLLRLIPFYRNNNRRDLSDSITTFIENKNPPLTKWEKLRLAALKANGNAEFDNSAKINEELYQMDVSDVIANYNAALNHLNCNRPKRALELLTNFDQRYNDNDREISWADARLAEAYNRTGQYHKAVEVALSYKYQKMYQGLAIRHLTALTRLDQPNEVDMQLKKYIRNGIYNTSGERADDDVLLWGLCDNYMILGNDELLKKYALQLRRWINNNRSHKDYQLNKIFVAKYFQEYQNIIDWSTEEIIDKSEGFDKFAHYQLLGIAYANLDQPEQAKEQIEKLFRIKISHPLIDAAKYYSKGKILCHLGENEEALKALQLAIENNAPFWSNNFKGDPDLLPLFDYSPFEALVAVKG